MELLSNCYVLLSEIKKITGVIWPPLFFCICHTKIYDMNKSPDFAAPPVFSQLLTLLDI